MSFGKIRWLWSNPDKGGISELFHRIHNVPAFVNMRVSRNYGRLCPVVLLQIRDNLLNLYIGHILNDDPSFFIVMDLRDAGILSCKNLRLRACCLTIVRSLQFSVFNLYSSIAAFTAKLSSKLSPSSLEKRWISSLLIYLNSAFRLANKRDAATNPRKEFYAWHSWYHFITDKHLYFVGGKYE